MRGRLLCASALAAISVAAAGCGGSGGTTSASEMQDEIKPDLQEQLAKNGAPADVDNVACITKDNGDGRCYADVTIHDDSGSGDSHERLGLTVTAGKDGSYIWEVDR